jgi:acyl dehydratase
MLFGEFTVGQVIETKSHLITHEEVTAFAAAYDPQPIHLDDELATRRDFGGVVASGFQTMGIAWRLWVEAAIGDHGRAGVGLTDARWSRPVYPGTEIRAKVTIEEARVTRRGHGLLTMGFEVCDSADNVVLTFRTTGLLDRGEEPSGASAGGRQEADGGA